MEFDNKQIIRFYVVSPQFLSCLFEKRSKREKVSYKNTSNRTWFLFGGHENPIGHGCLIKIGPSPYKSNHYRGGGIWILPEHRSKGNCLLYSSAMMRYALTLQPGPRKRLSGRFWHEGPLLDHYLKMGWYIHKEFSSFTELRKDIYTIGQTIFDIDLFGKHKISRGIVFQGDLESPLP